MTSDSLQEEKTALRRRMRQRLRALPSEQAREESRLACLSLLGLPAFQAAACILAYMALPGECDPALAVEAAQAAGKTVAFPRCEEGGRLSLWAPAGPADMEMGHYGIWEPVPARCKPVQPWQVALAIVPGLAFDGAGGRLGRGVGYYDRLLKGMRAMKVGFAFSCQLLPAVPVWVQDVPVDALALPGKMLEYATEL